MKPLRIVAALVVLLLLGFGGFVAFRMLQPLPDGLDLARSKQSAAGLFIVAVEPEDGKMQRGPLHAWIASVSNPDGTPVADATIAIDGGMPQHGHGLPTEPRATGSTAPGKYRIEGVKFNMGGWWVLKLKIEAGGKTDTAEFNLVL